MKKSICGIFSLQNCSSNQGIGFKGTLQKETGHYIELAQFPKLILKGVFAKNERGYRRNAKNKRF